MLNIKTTTAIVTTLEYSQRSKLTNNIDLLADPVNFVFHCNILEYIIGNHKIAIKKWEEAIVEWKLELYIFLIPNKNTKKIVKNSFFRNSGISDSIIKYIKLSIYNN